MINGIHHITAFKELQNSPVRDWLEERQKEIEKEGRHMEGAKCHRNQGMSLFIDELLAQIKNADTNMVELRKQQYKTENKGSNAF